MKSNQAVRKEIKIASYEVIQFALAVAENGEIKNRMAGMETLLTYN